MSRGPLYTHKAPPSVRSSTRKCCICGSCSSRAWLRWKHDKYCQFFQKEGSLTPDSHLNSNSQNRSLCKACYERWRQWHVRHGISKETRNLPPSSSASLTSAASFGEFSSERVDSPVEPRIRPIKPLPIRPVLLKSRPHAHHHPHHHNHQQRVIADSSSCSSWSDCESVAPLESTEDDFSSYSLPSPHNSTIDAVVSLMRLASSPPPPPPPSAPAPAPQPVLSVRQSAPLVPHVVDMLEATSEEPKAKRARIDLTSSVSVSSFCPDELHEVDHEPQSLVRNWRWLHWDPTTKGYIEVGSRNMQYQICSDDSETEDSIHNSENLPIGVSS